MTSHKHIVDILIPITTSHNYITFMDSQKKGLNVKGACHIRVSTLPLLETAVYMNRSQPHQGTTGTEDIFARSSGVDAAVFRSYIYIYAFSRRFYPNTVHSGYTLSLSMCIPWDANRQVGGGDAFENFFSLQCYSLFCQANRFDLNYLLEAPPEI